MAELTERFALELLRPILDFIVHYDERKAAKTAGTLRFWRDGMLGHLQKIRDGKATAETFVDLETDLKESEGGAQNAMAVLRTLRGKIGAGRLADSIDQIVDSDPFGKELIRYDIGQLLHKGMLGNDVRTEALDLCNRIATLNAMLDQLHRMVYDR